MNATGAIVAAVDFSEGSTAVVSHAIAVAEATKRPLMLVHVIDSGVLRHHSVAVGRRPETSILVSQAQSRLQALVSGAAGNCSIGTEVKCGRPVDEIHAVVERSNASLLVMGANDLTKKRLGSVASNCLRTVPCDVLILRDWQEGGFRKILVCTDLTSVSGYALQQGVALARLHGAKLDIAYVMYPPALDIWGEQFQPAREGGESYEQSCRGAVAAQMDAFVNTHAPDLASVDHGISILESVSPGLALKYHVVDSGADLAVLGSQLHSRFANLFSAATGEHLLHGTTVSVLAVREHSANRLE
jgi:nucleotide-binding universal stress UspA family protein